MNDRELFETGRRIRSEVAGADMVEKAFATADDFTLPMQELVTEHAWGAIWSRPGLDRRSRSILNIGMLAAANRPDEFSGHIKAGIANGLSKQEIQELLLQVAVYLGMPAGLSSFRLAKKAFDEMGI